MFTVVIILVVALIAIGLYTGRGRMGGSGGRGLQRRFGPEYDSSVTRHDGDSKAADQELGERVKRYGSLTQRPLPPTAREQYEAQWAGIQEQFIDSPQKAVTDADTLLAQLATDRGFPDGAQFEEQIAALSVHHATQVHGYRRVHTAVRAQNSTEEMREAMLEARGLFDALVTDHPADSGRGRRRMANGRSRAPWTRDRRNENGSGTS